VTTSVITATVNRESATGTYELETLTEYKSLRQHITVTTTTMATATQTGDLDLQTVALVILAGGVAWVLAGRLPQNLSYSMGVLMTPL